MQTGIPLRRATSKRRTEIAYQALNKIHAAPKRLKPTFCALGKKESVNYKKIVVQEISYIRK